MRAKTELSKPADEADKSPQGRARKCASRYGGNMAASAGEYSLDAGGPEAVNTRVSQLVLGSSRASLAKSHQYRGR